MVSFKERTSSNRTLQSLENHSFPRGLVLYYAASYYTSKIVFEKIYQSSSIDLPHLKADLESNKSPKGEGDIKEYKWA